MLTMLKFVINVKVIKVYLKILNSELPLKLYYL